VYGRGGDPAIVGLGVTEVGKVYGRSASQFAAEAVRLALSDAGLTIGDVDGLLVTHGASGGVGIALQHELGLRNLRLLSQITQFGSTASAMVQYASLAISAGMAETVVVVHGDAPLEENPSNRTAYRGGRHQLAGFLAMRAATGLLTPNHAYALAARRHMATYGTTSEQFGAVAVATRQWAMMNPRAQMRGAITIDDHQNSRWIAEPLHLLDCCLISNGGVALVVTNAERARDLARPPVAVLGWGQGHPGYLRERGREFGLRSGAVMSGEAAMKMAGVTTSDIDVCELYDCYTYTTLISLEDYGFCAKGEGGDFVSSGAIAPGGSLPTNTGGGQLSGFYLWGMTPLVEAVTQLRGDAGERQVARCATALVSGNGGILDYHSTLVLGRPR
jgi:acetyl-CoA acetyltransferase